MLSHYAQELLRVLSLMHLPLICSFICLSNLQQSIEYPPLCLELLRKTIHLSCILPNCPRLVWGEASQDKGAVQDHLGGQSLKVPTGQGQSCTSGSLSSLGNKPQGQNEVK